MAGIQRRFPITCPIGRNAQRVPVPSRLRIELNGLSGLAVKPSPRSRLRSLSPQRRRRGTGKVGRDELRFGSSSMACAIAGDGLVQLPLIPRTLPRSLWSPGRLRVEFDGLAVAGDGLVQLPLIPQGVAEVAVGRSAFRVEFDGLAVAGDGLVQLSLSLQGIAEVAVDQGVFRIEFDGLAEAVDGLVQLSLTLQGVAEVMWAEAFSGRVRWPCGSRRWPRPTSLEPSGHRRGCAWAQAYFGSSSMACAEAGDGLVQLPLTFRASPRPTWTRRFGSSSMALR